MKIRMSLFSMTIAIIALVLSIVMPIIIQGPQGEMGLQGIAGTTGPQGIQGIQGEQGIPGINGSIGETGLKGDKGENGTQGEPGNLRGAWALGTHLSGIGATSVSGLVNSPIKIYWIATAIDNATLVVSVTSTSGETVLWREISFSASETKRGTEITLLNTAENYTLALSSTLGSFMNVNTDTYIWVAG